MEILILTCLWLWSRFIQNIKNTFCLAICQTSYEILLMIQVLNRIGLGCPDLETLCIKDQTLTTESQLFIIFYYFLNVLEVVFPTRYEIFRLAIILLIILWTPLLDVEKIIGWALSYHFMHSSEVSMKDSKLVISAERLFSVIFWS